MNWLAALELLAAQVFCRLSVLNFLKSQCQQGVNKCTTRSAISHNLFMWLYFGFLLYWYCWHEALPVIILLHGSCSDTIVVFMVLVVRSLKLFLYGDFMISAFWISRFKTWDCFVFHFKLVLGTFNQSFCLCIVEFKSLVVMEVCVESKLTCFCLCWSFYPLSCWALIRSVDLVHGRVEEGWLMLVTAQLLLRCVKFNLGCNSIFDSLLWEGDLYDIRVASILLIFLSFQLLIPQNLHLTCLKLVFGGAFIE